ncbi:MAG: tripartite tricarboxylate transporter substrate binding protein [Burkholderiaceae bacterium]|nr:tripartite tricarboxylate transporter substrate binding protein [Burkholderiaceae bacterium]
MRRKTGEPMTRFLSFIALAAAFTGVAPAAAQSWPSRPVTVIVPFPAGGGTDAFARPLSAQLTKQLGQQLVIENRGGAGGNLGAGIAAKAAPDGYTWFMGGVHHTIAPSVYPKLDYHLANDFVPVALVSSVPQVIVVNPKNIAATDLKGLIAYLKANPGKVSYGSAGNGSSHHLAGELFKAQTQTFVIHVPYRGAGPALQDLMGGQVDMMFDGLGSSANHIKGGRLKAIAVAGDKRAPGFADVPTAAEAGLPTYKVSTWYGLWAPKGTPAPVVERMASELKNAFASKELQAAWANLGAEPPTLVGKAFGDFVAGETRRWADVVKAGNIKAD